MFKYRKILWLGTLLIGCRLEAQIDPVERELIQLGYNQALEGHAPISGYAYYYYNRPSFIQTNLTLRLAVAPVYLDSEVGFSGLLGPQTDLGLGLAGGGFADSYSEIRQGTLLPSESFTGHGASTSSSIYHRFNPNQEIPLNGVLRGEIAQAFYMRDSKTTPGFELPPDQTSFNIRTGLRWGGREPLLAPDLAMEMSVWYEGRFRLNPESYGFNHDRSIQAASHLIWGRALLIYTLPESKHSFLVSLTAGTSARADRFSAFRLGGQLPLASEFPLTLPGYFYQEISATRFALINASYYWPLDRRKRWSLTVTATGSVMDYLPGLEQAGEWNSGVGGGITYRSTSQSWQASLGYSYGIDALRDGDRGAQSIAILVQFDLGKTKQGMFDPGDRSSFSRGLDRFVRSFQ